MRSETVTAPVQGILPQVYVFTRIESDATLIETPPQVQQAGQDQVALVAIHLRYKIPEKNRQVYRSASELADQGSAYLLQNLRRLVRKTDYVFLNGHSMYFVLLASNLQGAEIVEERLWDALLWHIHSMGEQDLPRPESVSIGHSACLLSESEPEELLMAARAISKRFGEPAPRVCRRDARVTRTEDFVVPDDQEELPRLARKLGIPYLIFLPSRPPRRVLQVFSTRLAQELRCYPVGRERNMLTVAMLNPQDHQALERLHKETGVLIFPVLTHPQALETALKQLG